MKEPEISIEGVLIDYKAGQLSLEESVKEIMGYFSGKETKDPDPRTNNTCPKCGSSIWYVEYELIDPHHYDGTSEYVCKKADETDGKDCDWKIGRFCGQRLPWKAQEPPYCKGKTHPVHA